MKKTFLFLLITAFAGALAAQEAQVPDFKNYPMLINADGSLSKLEKQNATISTRTAPFVGVTKYIDISGGKSDVRVHTDATFMLKTDPDTDPETLFFLQKSNGDRTSRAIDMENMGGWGSHSAKDKGDVLKLTFTKVSAGVYKVTAKGLQKKTEYAFVNSGQGNTGQCIVFCFGID